MTTYTVGENDDYRRIRKCIVLSTVVVVLFFFLVIGVLIGVFYYLMMDFKTGMEGMGELMAMMGGGPMGAGGPYSGQYPPGMQQPGMQQPGMQQPGMQQPDMRDPDAVRQQPDDGRQQPGMPEAGVPEPGISEPGSGAAVEPGIDPSMRYTEAPPAPDPASGSNTKPNITEEDSTLLTAHEISYPTTEVNKNPPKTNSNSKSMHTIVKIKTEVAQYADSKHPIPTTSSTAEFPSSPMVAATPATVNVATAVTTTTAVNAATKTAPVVFINTTKALNVATTAAASESESVYNATIATTTNVTATYEATTPGTVTTTAVHAQMTEGIMATTTNEAIDPTLTTTAAATLHKSSDLETLSPPLTMVTTEKPVRMTSTVLSVETTALATSTTTEETAISLHILPSHSTTTSQETEITAEINATTSTVTNIDDRHHLDDKATYGSATDSHQNAPGHKSDLSDTVEGTTQLLLDSSKIETKDNTMDTQSADIKPSSFDSTTSYANGYSSSTPGFDSKLNVTVLTNTEIETSTFNVDEKFRSQAVTVVTDIMQDYTDDVTKDPDDRDYVSIQDDVMDFTFGSSNISNLKPSSDISLDSTEHNLDTYSSTKHLRTHLDYITNSPNPTEINVEENSNDGGRTVSTQVVSQMSTIQDYSHFNDHSVLSTARNVSDTLDTQRSSVPPEPSDPDQGSPTTTAQGDSEWTTSAVANTDHSVSSTVRSVNDELDTQKDETSSEQRSTVPPEPPDPYQGSPTKTAQVDSEWTTSAVPNTQGLNSDGLDESTTTMTNNTNISQTTVTQTGSDRVEMTTVVPHDTNAETHTWSESDISDNYIETQRYESTTFASSEAAFHTRSNNYNVGSQTKSNSYRSTLDEILTKHTTSHYSTKLAESVTEGISRDLDMGIKTTAGKDTSPDGTVVDQMTTSAMFVTKEAEVEYVYRNTSQRRVKGVVIETSLGIQVERFLGIPFALPPVGRRRFSDSVLFGNFTSVPYEAVSPGPVCPQYPDLRRNPYSRVAQVEQVGHHTSSSEDCLYLNVWTPRNATQLKPVMVYIHGGSNIAGSGSEDLYDGTYLSAIGDVVVVTFNYRLNVFGWFHPGVTGSGVTGNQGLKDQAAALRWVRENVREYGGDPGRVTLVGEISGATAALLHLLSPDTQQLFNRIILMSALDLIPGDFKEPQQNDQVYKNRIPGVTDCLTRSNIVECLRNVSTKDLLGILRYNPLQYKPVIDGRYITASLLEMLERAALTHHDVIIGVNQMDAVLIIDSYIDFFVRELRMYGSALQYLQTECPRWFLQARVSSLTPSSIICSELVTQSLSEEEIILTAARIYGDLFITCPATYIARKLAHKMPSSKVYMYQLTYQAETNPYPPWWGVPLTAELQWVFGEPFKPGRYSDYTEEERRFSADIIHMWAAFANSGMPDGNSSVARWQPYQMQPGSSGPAVNPSYLQLNGWSDYILHHNTSIHSHFCDTLDYNRTKL